MKYKVKSNLYYKLDNTIVLKDSYPIQIESDKELTGEELSNRLKDEMIFLTKKF